jgi:predicted GNAT family N-acyltransferase
VYGDVDRQDAGAWHLPSADARPKLAGYLRVLLPNSAEGTKESFYASFGFEPISDVHVEDDIRTSGCAACKRTAKRPRR